MKKLILIFLCLTLLLNFVGCNTSDDLNDENETNDPVTGEDTGNENDQPNTESPDEDDGRPGTDGIAYSKSEDGDFAIVLGYNKDETEIVIASKYEGLPVREIGERAFAGKNITSVDIPDSVTVIGNDAFHGCIGLTSISIPDSVQISDNMHLRAVITSPTYP